MKCLAVVFMNLNVGKAMKNNDEFDELFIIQVWGHLEVTYVTLLPKINRQRLSRIHCFSHHVSFTGSDAGTGGLLATSLLTYSL